jgi:hypothetical protein
VSASLSVSRKPSTQQTPSNPNASNESSALPVVRQSGDMPNLGSRLSNLIESKDKSVVSNIQRPPSSQAMKVNKFDSIRNSHDKLSQKVSES